MDEIWRQSYLDSSRPKRHWHPRQTTPASVFDGLGDLSDGAWNTHASWGELPGEWNEAGVGLTTAEPSRDSAVTRPPRQEAATDTVPTAMAVPIDLPAPVEQEDPTAAAVPVTAQEVSFDGFAGDGANGVWDVTGIRDGSEVLEDASEGDNANSGSDVRRSWEGLEVSDDALTGSSLPRYHFSPPDDGRFSQPDDDPVHRELGDFSQPDDEPTGLEFSCIDLGHVQSDVHVYIVPFDDAEQGDDGIRERITHCVTSVRLSRQIDTVVSVHAGSDVPGADEVHGGAGGTGSPASHLAKLERTALAPRVLRVVTMPPCGVTIAKDDYLPITRILTPTGLDRAWSSVYQHLYSDTLDREAHQRAVKEYLATWPTTVSAYGASLVCKYYGWKLSSAQLRRFLDATDTDARISVFTQASSRARGAPAPTQIPRNINEAIAVERLLAPCAGALELVRRVGAMHAAATDACLQCVLVVACPVACLHEEQRGSKLWRVSASVDNLTQVGDAGKLRRHVHSVRSRLLRLLQRAASQVQQVTETGDTPTDMRNLVAALEEVTPDSGGEAQLDTLAWLACADVAPYTDRLPLAVALSGCSDDGVKLIGRREDGMLAWRPTRMLPGASNAATRSVAAKRQWAVGGTSRAPASMTIRSAANAQMERVVPVDAASLSRVRRELTYAQADSAYRAESRHQLAVAWRQYARVILDEAMAQRVEEWVAQNYDAGISVDVKRGRKLLARSRLEHVLSRYTGSAWLLV